jgi:hypothetical protein
VKEFNESVVRRAVYRFYIMGNQSPRVDGVGVLLQKAVEFRSWNISARLLLNVLFFGGRKRNQTGYLIEITNIRETRHAHSIATVQYRFKLENAYINELDILFASTTKTSVITIQCAVFLHPYEKGVRESRKRKWMFCAWCPTFAQVGLSSGKT